MSLALLIAGGGRWSIDGLIAYWLSGRSDVESPAYRERSPRGCIRLIEHVSWALKPWSFFIIQPYTRRIAMSSPVVLINVFSVPQGKEEEFYRWWIGVKENITKEPGFVSGELHRSLKPDARFNFINVAQWQDADRYWKAYEKSVTPMKAKLTELGMEMTPALF
ncbi:MAG: hypothetical protein C4294_03165, partial [Nitrospiraceae bacterium]